MENKLKSRVFDTMHPLCVLTYFGAVCVITMFSIHPVLMLISFAAGIEVTILQRGFKSGLITFTAAIPLVILMTVTNPIFVHSGRNVLFFVLGMPVTVQAMLYGANMGVMIAAVIIHFRNYSYGMSMEKLPIRLSSHRKEVTGHFFMIREVIIRFVPKIWIGKK